MGHCVGVRPGERAAVMSRSILFYIIMYLNVCDMILTVPRTMPYEKMSEKTNFSGSGSRLIGHVTA